MLWSWHSCTLTLLKDCQAFLQQLRHLLSPLCSTFLHVLASTQYYVSCGCDMSLWLLFPFLTSLFVFLLLRCESSLAILAAKPLSDV